MKRTSLFICCLGLIYTNMALARQPIAVTTARWHWQAGSPTMRINLGNLLTKKQKKMIEGGFTTISQLKIHVANKDGLPDGNGAFLQSRCSVKYDAWEEQFAVVRLIEDPIVEFTNSFDEYSSSCLSGEMSASNLKSIGVKPGQLLIGELDVIQTSLLEEQKIKEWLISQQSGVMQTLFSHMLGEMSLQQNLIVRVNIPSIPPAMGSREKKDDNG